MKFYGFGLVLVLTTSLVHSSQLHQQKECRLILDNCTDTVYPHLHNSEYMFPTSLESVNQMCKWVLFVLDQSVWVFLKYSKKILFWIFFLLLAFSLFLVFLSLSLSLSLWKNTIWFKILKKQNFSSECGANLLTAFVVTSAIVSKRTDVSCSISRWKTLSTQFTQSAVPKCTKMVCLCYGMFDEKIILI